MAFAEDLAAFVDLSDFGVEAEWLSMVIGTKKTVAGIFDNGYGENFDGLIGGQQPMFVCVEADVVGVAQDDSLRIAGTEYTVTNIEPDGVGMTTLRLRKV